MKNFIENAKKYACADLNSMSDEEKYDYYQSLMTELDKKLNDENIDLDDFEELIEVKKIVLSNLKNLTKRG